MKLYKKVFIVLLFFSIFQNVNAKERFIIDDIILKGLHKELTPDLFIQVSLLK